MLLRFTKIRAFRWLWLQLCRDYLSSGYDATVVLSLPACKVRGLPFFGNGSSRADTSSAFPVSAGVDLCRLTLKKSLWIKVLACDRCLEVSATVV